MELIDRTQSSDSERATAPTTKATMVPSGDTTTADASGYNRSPGGGSMESRVSDAAFDDD